MTNLPIKAISTGVTAVSLVATAVGSWVSKKEMDQTIEKKVKEEVDKQLRKSH